MFGMFGEETVRNPDQFLPPRIGLTDHSKVATMSVESTRPKMMSRPPIESTCGDLGRWAASIVVMATSLLLADVATAQRARSGKSRDAGIDSALVQKAHQAVGAYLGRSPGKLELFPYIDRIDAVRLWPCSSVIEWLLERLSDDSVRVRVAAAEALVELTATRHRSRIEQALRAVSAKDGEILYAKRQLLLAEFRFAKCTDVVRRYAQLADGVMAPLGQCSMHPTARYANLDNCPVCGMMLIRGETFARDVHDVQLLALRILAGHRDDSLPSSVYSILAGNAPGEVRFRAAVEWARCSPVRAFPFLDVMMQGSSECVQWQRLQTIAQKCPKSYVQGFHRFVRNSRSDTVVYAISVAGLVKSGDQDQIDRLREFLRNHGRRRTIPTRVVDYCLVVLGECGGEQDAELIGRFLDTPSRVAAGASLLQLAERSGDDDS